jgi:trimeric autotransporter adhesin
MRRFLTIVCLLCMAIPAGVSISGCTHNPGENYCNGLGYGLKIGAVSTITLQPQTTGISLAFGQTKQVTSPSALDCKGGAVTVSSYTYGSTNNKLVDISPSGSICAGTWNRNTGGGISDYTICSAPDALPTTNGLPYSVVYLTASADSVTSNPVAVYVHSPVTSISLVGPSKCLSQNDTAQLDAQACYSQTVNGQTSNVLLCAPSSVTTASSPSLACPLPSGVLLSSIPACTNSIGTLSFSVGTSGIATIDGTTNEITAHLPGTTAITASISSSGSSAGYFSTCPPQSIDVSLSNGKTSGTVTKGVTQNLTTTVTDTNGNTITGLTLDYQSTDPVDISVGSSGAITASYPGEASIYAVCQPTTCNPAPVNKFGQYGTGLSIASNEVKITTPGTGSQYVWYGAPNYSRYFVPVEMLTGTIGSTVRLPYMPNSMVMDKTGSTLFFGSSHELITYSPVANSLSKEDPNVPGVVLAVSPDGKTALINDQDREKLFIYTVSSGSYQIYGGLATAASWTPDSKTLYIVDSAAAGGDHTDTLRVYNVGTGFTTYSLPSTTTSACTSSAGCPRNLAITIPGVGAYASGLSTVSHTWCPTGTVGDYTSMVFYPEADVVKDASNNLVQTDVLAATNDGAHLLGAAVTAAGTANAITLSDIGVTIPATQCTVTTNSTTGTQTLSALTTDPTVRALLSVGVTATAVNQVVPSPSSSLAFITYTSDGTTTGAKLPYYVPASSGEGTLNYLSLTDSDTPTITAPVAGAFATDNSYFFVSTAGDNKIHYISVSTVTSSPATADTKQISPNLPACSPTTDAGCKNTTVPAGDPVPATAIVVKPRTTT